MTAVRLKETGIVYRNPRPNVRSLQVYFPSVVEVEPGEILVSFDRGSAMENHDVRSFLTRSVDGGSSWSEPAPLHEPDDPFQLISTSFRMSRSADEEILGLFTYFHRTHPDDGLADPATEGFVRTEFLLTRSGDGGRNWSDPISLLLPIDWSAFETCSPIVPLDRDQFLIPSSLWRNRLGEAPLGMKAVTFRSVDGGETWPLVTTVMDGWDAGVVHWEQKQAVFPDGRILAVCWAYDLRNGASLKNRYAFSSDGGGTFGPPREAPVWGETCTPLVMDDGRVLLLYRHSKGGGLWAHLCRFDEENWVPMQDLPVWGGESAGSKGAEDNLVERLAALKLGYPQMTRLSDGDVLAVFWCVEDAVSNIRSLRLKVD